MVGLKRTFRLVGVVTLVLLSSSWYQGEIKKESEVKAAYLYTFLKYMECAGEESDPIIIAVVGQDPFEGELQKYSGKVLRGRKIKILSFDISRDEIKTAEKCHILYIGDSAVLRQKKILGQFKQYNPLTIAENEWFLESGGMINLINQSRKIRWEVNYEAIKNSKIKISSKILRLAVNRGSK